MPIPMSEILSEANTITRRAKSGKVWVAAFPDGVIFQKANARGYKRSWATKGALITALREMASALWHMGIRRGDNWGYDNYEIFVDDIILAMDIKEVFN